VNNTHSPDEVDIDEGNQRDQMELDRLDNQVSHAFPENG